MSRTPVLSPGAPAPSGELAKLANVVHHLEAIPSTNWDAPPRIGQVAATWIAAATLVVAIIALVWVARFRDQSARPSNPAPTGLVSPAAP